MQHLLLIITTMSACVASAMHIEKRANSLRCDTPATCISSYETGSAQCSDGYKKFFHEAPGFAAGSYCERVCDNFERIECAAEKCTFYKGQCNRFPDNTICADAMNWCGTPIKTTKGNCIQLKMGQPVKYDDAAGTCDADPNAPKDDHFLRFIIGVTPADLNLFLSCAPVTSVGLESIVTEMKKVSRRCLLDTHPGVNTTPYEIVWRCQDKKDTFDKFKQVFKNACAVAAHPGDAAPAFTSGTG